MPQAVIRLVISTSNAILESVVMRFVYHKFYCAEKAKSLKKVGFFVLALLLLATPSFAKDGPAAAFGADFLGFHAYETPEEIPAITFYDAAGKGVSITDFKGKYVILNFWATWCAPCVEEMPALAALQAQRGGKDLAVVPVSFDFNPDSKKLAGFMRKNGAGALPLYVDLKGVIQRVIPTKGLPTTMILGRDGKILYIMEGGADWSSPKALAFIDFLLSSP